MSAEARPGIVTTLAAAVYDQTCRTRLLCEVSALGWTHTSTHPMSGAWWLRNGEVEVLVAFGGPRMAARAFSWRMVGGPAGRI